MSQKTKLRFFIFDENWLICIQDKWALEKGIFVGLKGDYYLILPEREKIKFWDYFPDGHYAIPKNALVRGQKKKSSSSVVTKWHRINDSHWKACENIWCLPGASIKDDYDYYDLYLSDAKILNELD
jgi:predicted nucleic acid-binding Zn finger protein